MQTSDRLTPRLIEALEALNGHPQPVGPAQFAAIFWPGKKWARGNGRWGVGPNASGRHGGRILTRLHRLGLVDVVDHYGYYTARINDAGKAALDTGRKEADRADA